VGEASGPCWLSFSPLCSECSFVINTTEKHKIISQGKHCIIILLVLLLLSLKNLFSRQNNKKHEKGFTKLGGERLETASCYRAAPPN